MLHDLFLMPGVLDLCGLVENGHCGYCQKDGKTSLGEEESGRSCSLGLWAHRLPTPLYQHLIDCGWRRSGLYLYKPLMERTCCPQYTIRLDSSKFFLSRNQKRVLRVMNDYLKNDIRPKCGPVQELDDTKNVASTTEKDNHTNVKIKNRSESEPTKKKERRRQRCFEKWKAMGWDVDEMKKQRSLKEEARRRTIESFILPYDDTWKHKLEVKLVSTHSEEIKQREEESFELYKKYQQLVHKEENPTKTGYQRFLCIDPFEELQTSPHDYGAYHQWYILDGKLVAVGAVDILPGCLSSKYLFYDPDFNFLSMGTYTALREIEYTKQLSAERRQKTYYYMGYYIESCPKMRYKGKFQPSELLCDQSLTWVPLSECKKLFASADSPFVVFRPSQKAPRKTINDLIVIANRQVTWYSRLTELIPDYATKEPPQVRSNLELLASLLPSFPQFNDLYIYVPLINQLATSSVSLEDSDDD